MLQGTPVLVKDITGKALRRRIWEDEGSLRAIVTTDDGWEKRTTMRPDMLTVTKDRIFKWNESLYNQMATASAAELPALWQRAEPWADFEALKKKFGTETLRRA